MFAIMSSAVRLHVCRLSSDCRLSVTFVRPTQAIEIFGNVSTPCGILAIHDLSVKILRTSSQGNPSVGGVKHKRGSRSNAISRKRCKIGAKLLTNRKSYMSFRLVPNSVTLDDLERRNNPKRLVISRNLVDFCADDIKVVENTRILSATEM